MAILISALIILACVLLVLAVLIQNPKGGGLASGFQSGSQMMGVRRTTDFLEKATWTLAILLLIFSIFSANVTAKARSGSGMATESDAKSKAEEMDANKTLPVQPGAQQPAPGQPGQPAPGQPQPAPGQSK
ncbi:MAG: preprotein translocase subunit SecG [Bacteroidia bacterium]